MANEKNGAPPGETENNEVNRMGIMSEFAMDVTENEGMSLSDLFDESMLPPAAPPALEAQQIPRVTQPAVTNVVSATPPIPPAAPVGVSVAEPVAQPAAPSDIEPSDDAENGPIEEQPTEVVSLAEPQTASPSLEIAEGGADKSEEPDESEKKKQEAEEQKKKEHEAAEAKRKAEWEAKQLEKKKAEEESLAKIAAMSPQEIIDASMNRVGEETERMTRRNMKDCVSEHIQTVCIADAALAKLVLSPRKSMLKCFRYINRMALEYVKKEAEARDEKLDFCQGVGEDIPDDLCYKWAEEYFRDMDCEEDKEKEEEFVPKPYRGTTATTTKPKKKKEPVKKPEPKKPAKPQVEGQIALGEVV